MDWIHGGSADDVLIGGANDDRVDGGQDRDLLFGDNVELDRSGEAFEDFTNPRFRTLQDGATTIYGETPDTDTEEGNDGEALIGDTDYENPDGNPIWADLDITLLDHSAADEAAELNNFGHDYMAGGSEDDQIFGMLGDDIIQGDGSIGTPGAPTLATAYRTNLNMLLGTPSVENALTDGDDYIEGNGGTDVVFGNLGQDDIIGGSSSLFSLITPEQRPDGMDLLFGGAGGEDLNRNSYGDSDLADGHALDSDAIVGDNANIYRLLQTGDTSQYAFFNYDLEDTTRGDLRIIPRPVELLDYTPGGPEHAGLDAADFPTFEDLQAALGDIGDNDEIHGEAGDDFIYGMVGNDVLYGEGQDDDIIGGWGHDWISGGTGQDGVLGDDGRIYTSRNSDIYGEDLYGISTVTVNVEIGSNSPWASSIINVEGELKKTVNLTPFNVAPDTEAEPQYYNAQFADDIIYGGLGSDWLHGGSGDDAMSGAEALPTAAAVVYPDGTVPDSTRTDGTYVITGYWTPFNPGHVLGFAAFDAEEFAAYDENDPLRKIVIDNGVEGSHAWDFFLNFNEAEGPIATDLGSTLPTDGNDRIFGDLGNDWIVGGTGQDHTYGGYGNDLLNNDDNHDSTEGTSDPLANNTVDGPEVSYEDISFGGAGRDVLIANTAGDRQWDYIGEFNSYVLPFAPFGPGPAERMFDPSLEQYMYDLSESDGIDMTRAADTGTDPARNGEPEGELGLLNQQDPDMDDQRGAPGDPQAGNGKNQSDLKGPKKAETSNTVTVTDDSEMLVFDGSTGVFEGGEVVDDDWEFDGETGTWSNGVDSFNMFTMTEEQYLMYISVIGAVDDDGKTNSVLINWDAI